MDKVNNINFTGIKNIACATYRTRNYHPVSKNISMVLTDDFNGKELSEFKRVINKISDNPRDLIHPYSSQILNVEYSGTGAGSEICINGMYLEKNDRNLPAFTYLARLTKKIAGMKDNEMVVNNDYQAYAADECLIYGIKLSDVLPKDVDFKEFIKGLFNKGIVKERAENLNEFIQQMMNDFFKIN